MIDEVMVVELSIEAVAEIVAMVAVETEARFPLRMNSQRYSGVACLEETPPLASA